MKYISDSVRIRKIAISDASELKRIHGVITNSSSPLDFQSIIEEQIYKNAEDTCLVADYQDQVIGFMISYIIYGGFGLEKSAWIATLGVDPEYMGQGIGTMLAREIFSVYKSKGIAYIYTSVMWNSIDILSFFKTLGFDRSDFINLKKQL